jgi:hypothetical protein
MYVETYGHTVAADLSCDGDNPFTSGITGSVSILSAMPGVVLTVVNDQSIFVAAKED